MMIVYGIKNCDTVKKALTWLKANKITFQFHDYKTEGITAAKLKAWCEQVGWESLLNKKGTTWRKLDEATQASVTNESVAIRIMMSHTSIIKRPLMEEGNKVVVLGFDEGEYKNKIR
jgi:arsenate reductase (glutaredoxin)